jgi:hypothetical protein
MSAGYNGRTGGPFPSRSRNRAIERSQYRQVRLTFTQEVTGKTSYALYAKGLNQAWNEHQCLLRSYTVVPGPLLTLEDVIAAVVSILEEQMMPRGDE